MQGLTLNTIMKCALAVMLAVQSLMPASIALAKDAGYDVSAFMCAPADAAPSADAAAHFQALLSEIDNAHPDDIAADSLECSFCLAQGAGVLAAFERFAVPAERFGSKPVFNFDAIACVNTPRGPPLGGRAPPAFL